MLSEAEFDRITEEVYRFHTKRAPGLPIAVAMVDLAKERLGPITGKLNAIAESQACIADVIQVLTGCTVGNRYLKILKDIGRYALTLYDRETGIGVRVFVDYKKLDQLKTPQLYKFFLRKRGEEVSRGGKAREASAELIVAEFKAVKRDIFGCQKVKVLQTGKPQMLPAEICPVCGESYLQRNSEHLQCDVCSGRISYYEPLI